jgi:proline iminopeptidase
MAGSPRRRSFPPARLALVAVVLAPIGVAAAELPDALRPGIHTTTIGGLRIAYHVAGRGPVVLAHPGGPGAEWSYLRMPELEALATVVYIEPVGTGASGSLPEGEAYAVERYVADVDGLREHLGLDDMVLLGHSHGGFVAQAYALTHPDRLRGLILYDTTPTTGPEWQKDVEANLAWFKDEPWFAEATTALAEETSARTDEQMTAIFRREMPLYFASWSARAAEYEPLRQLMHFSVAPSRSATDPSSPSGVGVAPVFDVRERLASIKTPTLVIAGRRDFVCSERFGRLLHERIAGSRLVVLQESGHMGHVEEAKAFASAVGAFLRALP